MRYTKATLLIFGLGMLLGLAVVAAELGGIERIPSGVMALGLALLPVALVADGRAFALLKLRRKPPKARRAPARRRRSPARRTRR
jgi:hypothetical protein